MSEIAGRWKVQQRAQSGLRSSAACHPGSLKPAYRATSHAPSCTHHLSSARQCVLLSQNSDFSLGCGDFPSLALSLLTGGGPSWVHSLQAWRRDQQHLPPASSLLYPRQSEGQLCLFQPETSAQPPCPQGQQELPPNPRAHPQPGSRHHGTTSACIHFCYIAVD